MADGTSVLFVVASWPLPALSQSLSSASLPSSAVLSRWLRDPALVSETEGPPLRGGRSEEAFSLYSRLDTESLLPLLWASNAVEVVRAAASILRVRATPCREGGGNRAAAGTGIRRTRSDARTRLLPARGLLTLLLPADLISNG